MSRESSKKIMLLIFILTIIFFIYENLEFDNYLKDNYAFTVGKSTGYSGRGGTNRSINFIYYVGNKRYEGSTSRDYELNSPLKRYYRVKYSTVKPEISEIYLDEEIIDTLEIIKAGFKISR